MKWIILILILGLNTSYAQKVNDGGLIEYTVTIKSDEYIDCDDIRDNLYPIGRIRWLNYLYKALISGKSIAYQYLPDIDRKDIFKYPLSEKALKSIMIHYDTFYVYTSGSPDIPQPHIRESALEIENIHKIRFLEKWEITPQSGLTKQIVAFAPVFVDDEYNDKPLFWLKPDIISDLKKEVLISEWIEYRVPLSDTIKDLPTKSWMKEIIHQARNGNTNAFHASWYVGSENEPTEKISKEDINLSLFTAIDTVYVPDATNPDILIPHTLPQKDLIPMVEYAAFREQWTLHPVKGLIKKVIAYAPVVDVYTEWGQVLGTRKLFWLK